LSQKRDRRPGLENQAQRGFQAILQSLARVLRLNSTSATLIQHNPLIRVAKNAAFQFCNHAWIPGKIPAVNFA
jgi:hypothetical protein